MCIFVLFGSWPMDDRSWLFLVFSIGDGQITMVVLNLQDLWLIF
jgi:hypothetical protein